MKNNLCRENARKRNVVEEGKRGREVAAEQATTRGKENEKGHRQNALLVLGVKHFLGRYLLLFPSCSGHEGNRRNVIYSGARERGERERECGSTLAGLVRTGESK